jgi:hypothetical protein
LRKNLKWIQEVWSCKIADFMACNFFELGDTEGYMAGPQVTLNEDGARPLPHPLCPFAAHNCHAIIASPFLTRPKHRKKRYSV